MTESKQQIISSLFQQGILVTPQILSMIEGGASLKDIINANGSVQEKPNTTPQNSTTSNSAQILSKQNIAKTPNNFKISFEYEEHPRKHNVQDFVTLFNNRFKLLSNILRTRAEMEGVTAIRRIDYNPNSRQKISVIGYIIEINETRNGHIMLTIEDKTGFAKVLVNKNRPDIFDVGQQLVLDDVIGIVCGVGENILYAESIVFPDIPHKEIKKAPFPVKACFTSDLHCGGHDFLEEEFLDLIAYLNGEHAKTDEEKQQVAQIKYLFLVGDLIEGVGIYPGQENDLKIISAKEQYDYLATLLSKLRKDIHIIACGGNHDTMRLAEPQPHFPKKYCQALYDLENFTSVTNPGMINIASTKDFPGIDVLLYHGFSFPYYFDRVSYIRQAGGINRMDLVMEFLLKRRHLAPTHTSTQYIPDIREDFMAIKKVPDIFASGHVHKVMSKNYKSVTMLNCSAWFKTTDYMKKLGIEADPANVHIVDLQTRKVETLDFRKEGKDYG